MSILLVLGRIVRKLFGPHAFKSYINRLAQSDDETIGMISALTDVTCV